MVVDLEVDPLPLVDLPPLVGLQVDPLALVGLPQRGLLPLVVHLDLLPLEVQIPLKPLLEQSPLQEQKALPLLGKLLPLLGKPLPLQQPHPPEQLLPLKLL